MAQRFQLSSSAEAIAQVQDRVSIWRRQLERLYPEGYQECRGVAAGLEMDEETYFTALFSMRAPFDPPQCTTLGFHNRDGQPLLAKTDDIFAHELGVNVLEITHPDSGHRHAHFHAAGSIWTVAGMNERGLSMAMTGIPGPTLESEGLSSIVALHTILPRCGTVAEAEEWIRALRINWYGFSLLLGDADGAVSLVEKTGAGMTILPQQPGGFLLHTNHILDPDFAARNPQQRQPFLLNGQRRYENALRLSESLPRSEEGMRSFLADRTQPGAICQRGEDGLHTDFAVILMPSEGRLVFWPGCPHLVEEEKLELSEYFPQG
jgi:hypothetical protein